MRTLPAVLVLLLVSLACGPAAEEPPPPPQRVENAALGLAIQNLPAAFTVAVNESSEEGGRLELAGPGGGRLDFLNGEIETSINLVQAARDHEASCVARPGGELKQRTEMQSPEFGLVYFSRGRYESEPAKPSEPSPGIDPPASEAVLEEEAVLLLIHPWQDRMLTVRYLYSVTEATTPEELRVRFEDELFDVFSELEGLPAPGVPASDAVSSRGGEDASE